MNDEAWLEAFWGDLLSEEAPRIEAAWAMIGPNDQAAVRDHLQRMVSEDGWAEVQRTSAQAALEVIAVLDGADEADAAD